MVVEKPSVEIDEEKYYELARKYISDKRRARVCVTLGERRSCNCRKLWRLY